MREVDLRSDTVTKPTPEMRRAMAEAEVGDDMLGEDPTANRLEAMAAEMLGKEAGILLSSGTMGNLVAALTHCRRGDEVILGDKTHMARAEAGGASVLGGVVFKTVRNDHRGMMDPAEVQAGISPDNIHYPPTRLIAMENTHNACGGFALTQHDIRAVADVARAAGIALHIDGARIFNASVSLETPVAELVKDADTVTFCLSKGLSAPVGSLLCGSRANIDEARRWRKVLGGAMRQAGVIAAAGIVALETMVERLAEDHANARTLARGLSEIPGIDIDPDACPTNLVFLNVTSGSSSELARRVAERGVRVSDRSGSSWRLVTHYGVTSEDVDYALDVIDSTFRDRVPT
jgi:threonine aldolase